MKNKFILGSIALLVLITMISFNCIKKAKANDTHKVDVVAIFQDFPEGVALDFACSIGYNTMVKNPEYNKNIPLVIPNPAYQPEYIPNPDNLEEMIPNPDYITPMIPNPEYVNAEITPMEPETIPNPEYQPETLSNPEYIQEFINNPVTPEDYIYYFLKKMIQEKVRDYRQNKILKEIDRIKTDRINAVPNVEL